MKTFKEEKVEIIQTKMESIKCDFCGKEVFEELNIYQSDITPFCIEPGYGSKYDTDRLCFDICDNCLEDLIFSKVKK